MDYTYGIQYTLLNTDYDSGELAEVTFHLPAEPTGTLQSAVELLDQYTTFFQDYGTEGENWKDLFIVRTPKIVWERYTGALPNRATAQK